MYEDVLDALHPHLTQGHPNVDENGNHWWPHKCLFHPDHEQSASFCLELGISRCFAEGKNYSAPQVMEALKMEPETNAQKKGRRLIHRTRTNRRPSAHRPASTEDTQTEQDHSTSRTPEAVYPYLYPDGTLSHWVYRFPGKVIRPFNPLTKLWQRPPNAWPLYGDHGHPESLNWLVVEGEKAVDHLNDLQAEYQGVPIRALTAGTSGSHKSHARDLAARLKQLKPKNVVLYPDQDLPGVEAMRAVGWALGEEGIPFTTPPIQGRLPKDHGPGLDDRITTKDQLEQFFADLCSSEFDRRLQQLEDSAQFFPARLVQIGNRLAPITDENVGLLYTRRYGEPPSAKQIKLLRARFDLRADHPSHQTAHRLHPGADAFWWRPEPSGWAYRIDARGVQFDSDPSGIVLFTHPNLLPAEYEHPHPGLWAEFTASFGLLPHESALLEAWLVCALTGQETPILLLKSPPETGKTTLGRFLVGLIEPSLPGFVLTQRGQIDERGFLATLKTAPALLLDNVSSLTGESEDLLSRLVTGHNVSFRPLYSDSVEHLHLRRALIMTSTNYDPYKGDLASRLIAVQPRVQGRAYDAGEIERAWTPHVNALRGYAFNCCQRYYERHRQFEGFPTGFRIGSLGRVLLSLGHNLEEIAGLEREARRDITSVEDERFQAIVDLWQGRTARYSTTDLLDAINEDGLTGKRLANWISEKAGSFELHGFRLRHLNTNGFRGYEFLTAR